MIFIHLFCCADSTIYQDTNLIFFSRKYCYCQVLHCCSHFYWGKNRSNVDCFLLSKCRFHVRPWNSSSINSFQVHRCWGWRFSILVIWYVHFCWVSNLITHIQSHFYKSYGELYLHAHLGLHSVLEPVCCKKQQKNSSWPVTVLWSRGPEGFQTDPKWV